MKSFLIALLCASTLALALPAHADSSLGFGLRGFRTVDDLEKPFKDTGMGGYVNWRSQWSDWVAGMLELDLYEDGYAGSRDEVLAPQAFLVLGQTLYAAVGGGILFSNSDFADSPFLALRLGVQGVLTDWFMFDVSLSYEYAEWKGVNVIDERFESDTVVLGAGLRMFF